MGVQSQSSAHLHDIRSGAKEPNSADHATQQEMTSMLNFRPVSFAILSGALMIVGSSVAFANPDQTNPRESSLATPCATAGAANCETVSQGAPVTSVSSSSTAAADEAVIEADHDARKDRNREHGH
jgi:hypothetical protein